MRILATLTALLTAALCTTAQTRAEYFIDSDPGYGLATAVESPAIGSKGYSLRLDGLSAGAHILYVRAQDEQGRWSPTVSHPLYVKPYAGFWRLEYFYDSNDPGQGSATALLRPEATVCEMLASLPTTGLTTGAHTLNVRGMRQDGTWSDVVGQPFLVVEHVEPVVQGHLEYFIDTDPGYGLGASVAVTMGENRVAIDLANVAPGAHILYMRSRDEQGRWSATVSHPLFVCRNLHIVALEYYFDTDDPGQGLAMPIPIEGQLGGTVAAEIAIDGLAAGLHTLHVRSLDSRGQWSVESSDPFSIIIHDTGIREVVADFGFDVNVTASCCAITARSGNTRNDCQVVLFDAAGRQLTSAPWPSSAGELTVPVVIRPGSALLISVLDLQDNRRFVRRVIMK